MNEIKCMKDLEEIMPGELVDNIMSAILYELDEIPISDKSIYELESLIGKWVSENYKTKPKSTEPKIGKIPNWVVINNF